MSSSYFFSSMAASPLFFLLLVVDLFLRGVALYKSARRDQRIWFVALLVINSVGILPLIYLLIQGDLASLGGAKPAAKKSTRRSKR